MKAELSICIPAMVFAKPLFCVLLLPLVLLVLQLTCGTWQYWLLVLSPLLVMLLVWAAARHHVLWKAAWKATLRMVDAGDLKWTTHSTTVYPAICECTQPQPTDSVVGY